MKLWDSLTGCVQIKIMCADIVAFLNRISQEKIVLNNVKYIDEMTIHVEILRKSVPFLEAIAHKTGCETEIIGLRGLYWSFGAVLRRPVLILNLIIVCFLTWFLPQRIMFIQITGNQNVPQKLIMEKAEQCGLVFGVISGTIRSEKIKNALLQEIPQLEWAGITTKGCVATISVKERICQANTMPINGVPQNIIASRDGIIRILTVEKGNGLCKVGQAVKKGQLLISGYTDCGLKIQAEAAKGEVFAETVRHFRVTAPESCSIIQVHGNLKKRYSICIGKKLIKLYEGSGISPAGCVRMYSEKFLTLPGGFSLPVSLISEQWQPVTLCASENVEDSSWLSHFSEALLQKQMVAGQILRAKTALHISEDATILNGIYYCLESIGKTKTQALLQGDV